MGLIKLLHVMTEAQLASETSFI